jgi:amidohydrolase
MNKETIYAKAESIADKLFEINDWMYHNPEIGHQEFKSSEKLANLLKEHGFEVTKPYAGMETAFRAEYDTGKEGPTIAILAEYDALPGIGHGCGHNVIGTGTVGGAIALKEAMEDLPGKLVMMGCPAEEGAVDNAGGKVLLVQAGAFEDIDAAIMFHPTTKEHRLGSTSNARYAMEIVYKGKTAHAAGAPHEGINALDAAIQTFNGWNALRQHVKEDVRIHGVITEGGQAPNIVPDRAVIRMYVRSKDINYLYEVVEKVKNCAKAGALAAGAEVEMRKTANTYKNIVNNSVLSELFVKNMEALGEEVLPSAGHGAGSTDMSDVTQEIPGMHPYISVSKEKLNGHSTDLADATVSKTGHKAILLGAKSMAGIAYDLFTKPEYLKAAKEEFEAWKKENK